jgi:hypothetical protein
MIGDLRWVERCSTRRAVVDIVLGGVSTPIQRRRETMMKLHHIKERLSGHGSDISESVYDDVDMSRIRCGYARINSKQPESHVNIQAPPVSG